MKRWVIGGILLITFPFLMIPFSLYNKAVKALPDPGVGEVRRSVSVTVAGEPVVLRYAVLYDLAREGKRGPYSLAACRFSAPKVRKCPEGCRVLPAGPAVNEVLEAGTKTQSTQTFTLWRDSMAEGSVTVTVQLTLDPKKGALTLEEVQPEG